MATTSDIKKGIIIKFKDSLWLVTEFQFVNPGKGSAFFRTKLKNIKDGKVVENTFKSGESIEIGDLTRKNMQFLYADGDGFNFMDPQSYDQILLNKDIVGDRAPYLKEDLEVMVLFHESSPVTLEIPIKITYEVTDAPPAVKGDTASGNLTKEVTLENGLKIQAPIFIKQGDKLVINTEKGEYVERA